MVKGDQSQPGPDWERGIDGNWYPPKPPRGRPHPVLEPLAPFEKKSVRVFPIVAVGVMLVAVTALVIGIVVTVRGTDDNRLADVFNQRHQIGDTAHTGDLDVTVTRAENPHVATNGVEAAPEGQHLVAIEVTLRNTRSDRVVNVSSPVLFQLTDASGAAREITISSDFPAIDGQVLPGGARTGVVVYRVPDAAKTPLTLRVKGEVTAEGITFTIP